MGSSAPRLRSSSRSRCIEIEMQRDRSPAPPRWLVVRTYTPVGLVGAHQERASTRRAHEGGLEAVPELAPAFARRLTWLGSGLGLGIGEGVELG